MNNKLLEICCFSIQSAVNAQHGGAQRIELCQSLSEGGTTPSYGLIKIIKELLSIKLHVIIRPRGGDFLYSNLEFEVMKRDIQFCKEIGVNGVVLGLLKKDGSIDKERTAKLVSLARPMNLTFHRAFDMVRNPFQAIEDLIDLGVDRVLTSGQEKSAIEGQKLIKELIEKAAKRIIVLPGAGINETNIQDFAKYTKANEFHLTARSLIKGTMEFRNNKINMGSTDAIPEYDTYEADTGKIKEIAQILSSF